jgi:hypothetical protein
LGLCVSVYARSGHRATFGTLFLLAVVLFLWSVGLYNMYDLWLPGDHAAALVPPLTLGVLAFSPELVRAWWNGEAELQLGLVACGPLAAGLAGLALWGLANHRFRVQYGRVSKGPAPQPSVPLPPPTSLSVRPIEQPPRPPAGRRLRRWGRRGLQLAVVSWPLLLLSAAVWQVHRAGVQEYRRVEAAVDAQDPGWRIDELEARRKPVPDDRNGGAITKRVKKLVPAKWPADEYYTVTAPAANTTNRLLRPQQAELLEKELKRAAAALVEARRILDFPDGRFGRLKPTANDSFFDLTDTQDSRTTGNLLSMDALARAQRNDGDGAVDSCRGVLHTGRCIGDEPLLISMLVRMAMRAMAASHLDRTLALTQPGEKTLHRFQEVLELEERENLFLIGMRGERAWADSVVQRLMDGSTNIEAVIGIPARSRRRLHVPNPENLTPLLSGSLWDQRAELLQIESDFVAIADQPSHTQAAAFAKKMAGLTTEGWLVRLIVPAVSNVSAANRRSLVHVRTALVAAALERHRLRRGAWPATLTELTPGLLRAVPADPHTGRPLGYRRQPDGVVVYSAGQDATDNGGTLDPRGIDTTFGFDMGIKLWDPAARRQPPPDAPPKPEGEMP